MPQASSVARRRAGSSCGSAIASRPCAWQRSASSWAGRERAPGRPWPISACGRDLGADGGAEHRGERRDHRRRVLVGEHRQAGDHRAAVGERRQRLGERRRPVGVVGGVDVGRRALGDQLEPAGDDDARRRRWRPAPGRPRRGRPRRRPPRGRSCGAGRGREAASSTSAPGILGGDDQAGGAFPGDPLGQLADLGATPVPAPGSMRRGGRRASRRRSRARSPPATRCGRGRPR